MLVAVPKIYGYPNYPQWYVIYAQSVPWKCGDFLPDGSRIQGWWLCFIIIASHLDSEWAPVMKMRSKNISCIMLDTPHIRKCKSLGGGLWWYSANQCDNLCYFLLGLCLVFGMSEGIFRCLTLIVAIGNVSGRDNCETLSNYFLNLEWMQHPESGVDSIETGWYPAESRSRTGDKNMVPLNERGPYYSLRWWSLNSGKNIIIYNNKSKSNREEAWSLGHLSESPAGFEVSFFVIRSSNASKSLVRPVSHVLRRWGVSYSLFVHKSEEK